MPSTQPAREAVQKVFQDCISNRNSQSVLDALESGIVTTETVYQQFSLLHIASANGRAAVVKDLVSRGCDNLQLTALHMAASKGNPLVVQELIKARANISEEDQNGCTPLHCALSNNRVQAAEALIKAGADIFRNSKGNLTPVQMAGYSKNVAAFVQMAVQCELFQFASCTLTHYRNYLHDNGQEDFLTKFIDSDGNTILLLAIRNIQNVARKSVDHTAWNKIIEELIGLGSSVRVVNKANNTPFSILQNASFSMLAVQKQLYNKCFNEKNKRLDLSRLSLRCISPNIMKCICVTTPRVIDLRENYLDTIPEELAQLAFIENIKLEGNPLRFVPKEFQTAPWVKQQKYFMSIQNRAARWKERKIMFVGEEETGKSTLIQCFLTKRNKTSCKENLATDGIQVYKDISLLHGQIKDATSSVLSQDLLINAWDLGGQQVFYPTHQFFMSNHATYIVVFNLVKPNYSRIEYWLRTLKLLANSKYDCSVELPPAEVYLVGTHADNEICTEEYLATILEQLNQKFRKNVYRNLQGIYTVSSKTGSGIGSLKEQLSKSFLNTSINIPPSWVRFIDHLRERKEFLSWTTWVAYRKWARDLEIPEEELFDVTKFLCYLGSLVFHESKRNLEESLIVLDPQWLSDVMTCIISVRTSNWIRGGVLEGDKVSLVFGSFPQNLHTSLLDLLQNFQIIYPSRNSGNFIIPSLLDAEIDQKKLSKRWEVSCPPNSLEVGRVIRFPFLPIGFFDRLIAHVLHLDVVKVSVMWRHGLVLSLAQSYSECNALIKFNESNYELQVRVRYVNNGNNENDKNVLHFPGLLLRIILEVIDTFTGGYNMEFDTKRFVVCSHCIKNGAKQPFLFPFYEIIETLKDRSLFVFCEYIKSPTRCVNVSNLAPDIAMADMQEILSADVCVDKEIGRGGFGLVYSGTVKCKENTQIPVAIKEIIIKGNSPNIIEDSFMEFQREAFLMSKLNHPNLIKFYGITIVPLRMILELVPGGDLLHFLHPEIVELENGKTTSGGKIEMEKFPWKLRLLIALDIAQGMRYLQQINPPIIHRDLRSPNIFLKSLSLDPKEVRAKVADFGLSRSSAVGLSGALGTWQWVAPEVLKGTSSYNELSDNYSYGMCCWEIATRNYPFQEFENNPEFMDPTTNTIAAHLIKPHIIDKDLRPSMPPPEEGAPQEFIDIINGCLSKDPSTRPTFDEIVKQLRTLLELPPESRSGWRRSVSHSKYRRSSMFRDSLTIIEETEETNGGTDNEKPKFTNIIRSVSPSSSPPILVSNEFTCEISALSVYKDACILGFSDGSIRYYDKEGNHLVTWTHLHIATVSTILFIRDENIFWSSDGSGCLSIWDCVPSLGDNNLVKQLPQIMVQQSLQSFIAVKMILVSRENCLKSVWVYTQPNLGECIRVYNHQSGMLESQIPFRHQAGELAQYGNSVWITASCSIYIYNASTGDLQVEWKAHDDIIISMTLVGDTIWTGDLSGIINVWQSSDGQQIRCLNSMNLHYGSCVQSLVYMKPNHVISMAKKFLVVWDATTGVPQQEINMKSVALNIVSYSSGVYSVDTRMLKKWPNTIVPTFRRAVISRTTSDKDCNQLGSQRTRSQSIAGSPVVPNRKLLSRQRKGTLQSSSPSSETKSGRIRPTSALLNSRSKQSKSLDSVQVSKSAKPSRRPAPQRKSTSYRQPRICSEHRLNRQEAPRSEPRISSTSFITPPDSPGSHSSRRPAPKRVPTPKRTPVMRRANAPIRPSATVETSIEESLDNTQSSCSLSERT